MNGEPQTQLNSGAQLVTTYLEMTSPPLTAPPRPPAGEYTVQRVRKPTGDFYRFLYNGVGRPHHWWERNELSDEELFAITSHDLVEIHAFYMEGCPAGYVELDRRAGNDIEIAYFGVFPEYQGRGIGPYLLRLGIDQAWAYEPSRLWVRTCTEDSPRALPLYRRFGFEVYKRKSANLPEGLISAKAKAKYSSLSD